jgi:hypothetical protein
MGEYAAKRLLVKKRHPGGANSAEDIRVKRMVQVVICPFQEFIEFTDHCCRRISKGQFEGLRRETCRDDDCGPTGG